MQAMNATAGAIGGEARIDKKEQAKSLKTIQDCFDLGDFPKALKYINMSNYSHLIIFRTGQEHQCSLLQSHEGTRPP